MSKKNGKVSSEVVNEINNLLNCLAAFGVTVQRKQSSTKAYIQILDEYQGNERIHTIYLKDDKIRYRGLNVESGNITEVDIEDNEVIFAMYSTLIMKLPVAFEAVNQLLSLVDKHGLVVVATPKY
ncbi:hypothetical protein HV270_16940 [Citrobacter freundii]|uniref:hypothetical protein n=1 Tax=Citrobacter freundii TaxID=546 RepID=UPI0015EAD335|nr:hypothetical protein [Citrobacter freundii]QLV93658.1 hypothetical protein HV270_16940 [Citrobacter freundii]